MLGATTLRAKLCFSLIVACSPARKTTSADADDRLALATVYVSAAAAGSARSRLSARRDRRALTLDFQSVTHDKHLRVSSAVEPPPALDDRHIKIFGRIERIGAVAYVKS
jgi:hypothetical protein